MSNEWWAMISPALTLEASGYLTTPHDASRVLNGPHVIGNGALTLSPADRQLVDYIRTLQLGWMQSVSWPIVVQGHWTGDDWIATERDASRLLHKLCCLLSLLWNESWQVRVGPQRSDAMAPRLLDDSSAPEIWDRNDVQQRGLRTEVELPEWIYVAWWHSYFDEATRQPATLSLWREGKLLQPEHPTFALVAFTASLEQAARLFKQTGDLAASQERPAADSGQQWTWWPIRPMQCCFVRPRCTTYVPLRRTVSVCLGWKRSMALCLCPRSCRAGASIRRANLFTKPSASWLTSRGARCSECLELTSSRKSDAIL